MEEFKLALIGSRGHLNLVLRELPTLPRVRLAAVADGGDSVEPILKWCDQNARPAPRRFDDWRAMLGEAKPAAVAVIGPFELHAEMCAAAIERGIHVLTEKPAALELGDLSRLRAACGRHPDVHLAAMMQSRYDAAFFTARRLIGEGAVGDVRLIDARKSYKLGRRAPYYRDRGTYGGTIPWVGSHAIDWVYWFASAAAGVEMPPFRSVYAAHSSAHAGENGTMERSAVCCFRLAGDRFANVSIDVFRPEAAPTHGDDWARVVGSEGVIEVRPGRLTLINGGNDGATPIEVSCDRTLLADFVDHVTGARPSIISTADTLDVTEACLLARQSADERREVSFPSAPG